MAIREKNGEQEPVVMLMDSGGGDPHAAVAFHRVIKLKQINLETIAINRIASAAVTVFLAGKTRKCLESAHFMLHEISWPGNKSGRMKLTEVENFCRRADEENKRKWKIIEAETKFRQKDIYKKPAHEIRLNARQALKKNFVQEIIKI